MTCRHCCRVDDGSKVIMSACGFTRVGNRSLHMQHACRMQTDHLGAFLLAVWTMKVNCGKQASDVSSLNLNVFWTSFNFPSFSFVDANHRRDLESSIFVKWLGLVRCFSAVAYVAIVQSFTVAHWLAHSIHVCECKCKLHICFAAGLPASCCTRRYIFHRCFLVWWRFFSTVSIRCRYFYDTVILISVVPLSAHALLLLWLPLILLVAVTILVPVVVLVSTRSCDDFFVIW